MWLANARNKHFVSPWELQARGNVETKQQWGWVWRKVEVGGTGENVSFGGEGGGGGGRDARCTSRGLGVGRVARRCCAVLCLDVGASPAKKWLGEGGGIEEQADLAAYRRVLADLGNASAVRFRGALVLRMLSLTACCSFLLHSSSSVLDTSLLKSILRGFDGFHFLSCVDDAGSGRAWRPWSSRRRCLGRPFPTRTTRSGASRPWRGSSRDPGAYVFCLSGCHVLFQDRPVARPSVFKL